MAKRVGNNGIVEVGADQVLQLTSWSLDEQAAQIEDTVMGDTYQSFQVGQITATGTIEVYYDDTDLTGQGALVPGASVALSLYPDGNTSGDPVITLQGVITGRTLGVNREAIIPRTFNFAAQGAVVEGVVP